METKTKRRLYAYSAGFFRQDRIRHILALSGYDITTGIAGPDALIAAWGGRRTARRSEWIAQKTGAQLVYIEDALLRSVLPGTLGGKTLGLVIDHSAPYFDARRPSDLEQILTSHPLDEPSLLDRATALIWRMKNEEISKYSNYDPEIATPKPGYVLVIDQTRADASITLGGADDKSFAAMLEAAKREHPTSRIVIKSHPETNNGRKNGYFGTEHLDDQTIIVDQPISPWTLLEGAKAVYAVTSGMGFEAILAGHRPVIFGQPFYAGWGLSHDKLRIARRTRNLTAAQLAAACLILYPKWYDPYNRELCAPEFVLDTLSAQARALREDGAGYVASGIRLWKKAPLGKFFGGEKSIHYRDDPHEACAHAKHTSRHWMVWASKATPAHDGALQIEDGFIRSRGLGAELIPPLSLVRDRQGIYFNPKQPSDIEDCVSQAIQTPNIVLQQSWRVIAQVLANKLSKYNITTANLPPLPDGHRILVPGQVEDDASIRLGCGAINTNIGLLKETRRKNPNAIILYKPHPDTEAGLRPGGVKPSDLDELADVVLSKTDPITAINAVDEIWTMTSLLGFEALLRDRPVTCLGIPFYAGWGLTTDLLPTPTRRQVRPNLMELAYAALVLYPRYYDPHTQLACPLSITIQRLVANDFPKPGTANRIMRKLQGYFAQYAHIWRD